jgi:hypothetical protein
MRFVVVPLSNLTDLGLLPSAFFLSEVSLYVLVFQSPPVSESHHQQMVGLVVIIIIILN